MEHLDNYITDNNEDNGLRFSYKIVKDTIEMLNATFTYRFHNSFGYIDINSKNGSGYVGDLVMGKKDVGLTHLYILPHRQRYFEFYATVYIIKQKGCKFILISPPLSYNSNIYLLPFDPTLWYSCIGLFLFCLMIFYIIIKAENYRNQQVANKEANNEVSFKNPFSDIILFNVTAICVQG